MFSEDDLWEALDHCVVPLSRLGVAEAGLVRSASLEVDRDAPGAGVRGMSPRFLARIMLRAPGGDEILNAQLRAAVENRLLGLPSISRAEVLMDAPLFAILPSGPVRG